jgi:hypothetical protein
MTSLGTMKPGSRFAHPVTGEPMRLLKVYAGSVLVQPVRGQEREVNGRRFHASAKAETWSRATRVGGA